MTLSALLRATELITEDMTTALRVDGLTPARAKALWTLAARAPITQRELADALDVTPRNVTTLVDALEDAGFVARGSHPDDRRAIRVDMTEKGRTAVAHMEKGANRLAEQLFGGLSQDELAVVTRSLTAVAEHFTS